MTAKRCSKCGVEKPLTKFYRQPGRPDELMHCCKCCHNGLTETNLRRASEVRDRQFGDPDESQIEAACQQIQLRWSKKKKASRKQGRRLA